MDKDFLLEMLKTDSVSGYEIKLQKKILQHYHSSMDTQLTDLSSNVINVINPTSPTKVMLLGHIDEIGLYVSNITSDGFIQVSAAGGIYPSTYLGHHVLIHTKQHSIPGVVVNTRELSKKSDCNVHDLTIDIGAKDKCHAIKYVNVGDSITFNTPICPLLDDKLAARALDDRVGAFIILEATKKAKSKGAKVGTYCVTTTGEETSMRGAYFASSKIEPTMAIIVDVTYTSDYPGVNAGDCGDVSLGKGPVLCCSSIINKKMNERLKQIANKMNMSYQIETAPGRTGTDADKVLCTNKGVPLCLISLPLRYMHNPGEMCSLNDVQSCIDLICEFLISLDDSFDLDPFH